jgi:hypothetical protein
LAPLPIAAVGERAKGQGDLSGLEVDLASHVAADEILAPVDLATAGRVVEATGNLEVEVLSVNGAAQETSRFRRGPRSELLRT